ncbi:MAG: methyltransferase domain-containing protein [Ardenticatenia bacterium]|nr:methyltransferase domain-containing protein [Ardenticatenia bacterium]
MSNALKFENWIAASWDKSEPGIHLLYGITEWIHRRRSPYQEIVIARVEAFGVGLFLDAVVQLLEADEFVYHEHLVLPALLYHPAPRHVLILGGGDGLALREVLRDPRVESVVMVELDGHVVEVCEEHLAPLHRGSFADPRAQIIIGDARDYLVEAPRHFDVVIVDLVDPYGAEGMALYEEVITSVRRVLAPQGALSAPTGKESILPITLPCGCVRCSTPTSPTSRSTVNVSPPSQVNGDSSWHQTAWTFGRCLQRY